MQITEGRGRNKTVVFDSKGCPANIVGYLNDVVYKDKIISSHNIDDILILVESELMTPVRDTIFRKTLYNKLKDKFGSNCSKKININYWVVRGYTKEAAEKAVIQEQTSRSNRQDEQTQNKKRKTWYSNNHRQDRGYQFYVDVGLTHDEATAKMKGRNIKWLKSMKEAIKKDPTINKRKGRTRLELENECGVAEAHKIISSRLCGFIGVSKIQLEFVNDVIKFCGLEQRDCYFNENEWFLNGVDQFYYYDFKIGRKIVEFNGDFWHMNPTLYTENCINKVTKKQAKDVWVEDDKKKELAIDKGYDIMTVWESDYKHAPKDVLNKVRNFLTNK